MDEGVIYAFSKRHDGNMSLTYGNVKDSLSLRRVFLEKLDIDYRDIVCAKQVHASSIACVGDCDKGKGALNYDAAIEASDALITNKKNIPLGIFTADCLSVFLYSPRPGAIGLVHAGWRGTKDNISSGAIRAMRNNFGVEPKDLYAAFGPSIRGCCYEVGSQCAEAFPEEFVSIRNKRYYLDLAGANKRQLLDAGISESRITDPGICTSCQNADFFSFRGEKDGSGRMISVIMLK